MTRTAQTAVKMLESLSEDTQEWVVEKLREIIEEIRDERKWEGSLKKKGKSLMKAAEKAHEEIAQGKASPMDYEKL